MLAVAPQKGQTYLPEALARAIVSITSSSSYHVNCQAYKPSRRGAGHIYYTVRPEGSEWPRCGCDGWLRGWGGWVGYYIFYPLSFILLGMCNYIIKYISF